MRALYLLPLLVLLPSCSKGNRDEGTVQTPKSDKIPANLRRYVYPGSSVEGVYAGKEASGITMRSPDPIEKVAKFYLDRLGLPDDKVVGSRVVSYLYRDGGKDIIITVEKSDDGSVISVSVASKGRK